MLGHGAQHRLVVGRVVVDAGVAAHREPVLHGREPLGDQLGVPQHLARVGALVVVVGIDDLVVGEEPMDGEVAGLGAHVRAVGPVEDRGMRPEVRRPAEEAHLVARGRHRHVDAERGEESPGPEAGADDHRGRVDLAGRGADAGHPAAPPSGSPRPPRTGRPSPPARAPAWRRRSWSSRRLRSRTPPRRRPAPRRRRPWRGRAPAPRRATASRRSRRALGPGGRSREGSPPGRGPRARGRPPGETPGRRRRFAPTSAGTRSRTCSPSA